MKKLLMSLVVGLGLSAGVATAGEIFVRFGPPRAPREVMVARPSPRHVWVPGHHRWHRERYVWSRGYWAVPPRARAVWVPGYWMPRRGGHVWISGFWR